MKNSRPRSRRPSEKRKKDRELKKRRRRVVITWVNLKLPTSPLSRTRVRFQKMIRKSVKTLPISSIWRTNNSTSVILKTRTFS
jgi:hypothetical protein